MVYGSKVLSRDGQTSVVGDIEQTANGNVVLRIGKRAWDGDGWEQTEHVVLTPEERDAMVKDLANPRS